MSANIDFKYNKPEESPGFLLWQVTMLWQRKMKRALDKLGITHTQFVLMATLAWLSRSDEPVTQTEIAMLSKTDRMMVSKVLRTLQGKGYVKRREHEIDSRAKIISLTADGQAMLQKALKVVHQVDNDFFRVLEPESVTFNESMLKLLTKN